MDAVPCISCWPVSLVIDEGGHPRKGSVPVGVSCQYCGTKGRTDNRQAAVHGAYSSVDRYGLADCALFPPESWKSDENRSKKAGLPPKRDIVDRSKPWLALDILGRQAVPGNSYSPVHGLGWPGLTGGFDVHYDLHVYLEEPGTRVPDGTGRRPTLFKTDARPVEAGELRGAREKRRVLQRYKHP